MATDRPPDTEAIRAALKWHGVEHDQRAAALEAFDRLVARLEAAERALAVIAPDDLEALATWLDLQDAHDGRDGTEVQRDLRRMARLSRAALAAAAPGETEQTP